MTGRAELPDDVAKPAMSHELSRARAQIRTGGKMGTRERWRLSECLGYGNSHVLRLAGGPTQGTLRLFGQRPHGRLCQTMGNGWFDRATRQGAARRLHQKRGREDSMAASVRALQSPFMGWASLRGMGGLQNNWGMC